MSVTTRATVTIWPASSLTEHVAAQLLKLGINVSNLRRDDTSVSLSRTPTGTLVMQVSLTDVSSTEGELARLLDLLQAADLNYVAWLHPADCGESGLALIFESGDAAPTRSPVSPAGERLLAVSDLTAFEHFGTEELLSALRDWTRLPLPEGAEPVSAREVQIIVEPDDCEVPETDR